jgi:hypothetical protein
MNEWTLLGTIGLGLIGAFLKKKSPLPNKLIPLVNLGIAMGAAEVVPGMTVDAALAAVVGASTIQQTAGYAKQKIDQKRGK